MENDERMMRRSPSRQQHPRGHRQKTAAEYIEQHPETRPVFLEARQARHLKASVRKQRTYLKLKGDLVSRLKGDEIDEGIRLIAEEMDI